MQYVRQSLAQGEKLVHIAQFHGVYVFSALFGIIVCTGFAGAILWAGIEYALPVMGITPSPQAGFMDLARMLHPGIKIFAFFTFLMGILRFAQMMVVRSTTEIAITDRRLIYKKGLIARSVGEINTNRIEGVAVQQSFMGRLLGYGRVSVRGMGVGEVMLPVIANPLRFRGAIDRAIKRKNEDAI